MDHRVDSAADSTALFGIPPPPPTCPIKSQLQHVNSSAVFPQVLMPPLGEAAQLKMDADNRGGVRHWVVGSKSTPAQEAGTKMMKFHLPPNHTPPTTAASNLFHLPFPHINTPLFPPHLLPPRVSCFTRSPLPPSQVTDFTFLSSPLAPPPQFSCLFPSFPAPPLLSSHLLLARSPENRKGGQLCHNTGSHFFPIASALSGSRIDVSGLPSV